MNYLLDTCVISDIARKADTGLSGWASAQDPLHLYLSELTLGEIEKGIHCGRLAAEGQRSGRPVSVVDRLLLASARVHGLTFVTRNSRDVEGRGIPVLNPHHGYQPG